MKAKGKHSFSNVKRPIDVIGSTTQNFGMQIFIFNVLLWLLCRYTGAYAWTTPSSSILTVKSCRNAAQERFSLQLAAQRKAELIVGLNKYSHDAGCCIVDTSGKVLFAQAKERLSRKKHDGGSVGELIDYALESIDASIEDISIVVSNNHHFRVAPFERRIAWHEVDPNNNIKSFSHLISHASRA